MKNSHRTHQAFPWIVGISLVLMAGMGCQPGEDPGPAAKSAPSEPAPSPKPTMRQITEDLRSMWPSFPKEKTLRSSDATRAARWLVGYNVCRAVETDSEVTCDEFRDLPLDSGILKGKNVTRMCRHWLGWLKLSQSAAAHTVDTKTCETFWNSRQLADEAAECRGYLLPLYRPVEECAAASKSLEELRLCQDRAKVAAAMRTRDPGQCPAELQSACHALIAKTTGVCGPVTDRLREVHEVVSRRALSADAAKNRKGALQKVLGLLGIE